MHAPAVTALIDVWIMVQGGYWLFWNMHWRAQGRGFYSAHGLYERLYTERREEIDRLAEAIAALAGPGALDPVTTLREVQGFVAAVEQYRGPDVEKALEAVKATLRALQAADAAARDLPFSAGVQNVVASIADTYLRDLYLLQQQAAVAPAAGSAGLDFGGLGFGDVGPAGAEPGGRAGFGARSPAGQQLGAAWAQLGGQGAGAVAMLGDALSLAPDGEQHAKLAAKALLGGGLLWGLWEMVRGGGGDGTPRR
jgi:hypothetical protein